jgi:hypothetical protein
LWLAHWQLDSSNIRQFSELAKALSFCLVLLAKLGPAVLL